MTSLPHLQADCHPIEIGGKSGKCLRNKRIAADAQRVMHAALSLPPPSKWKSRSTNEGSFSQNGGPAFLKN